MPSYKPLRKRFFAKVQVTAGCWLWTGTKHKQGYGRLMASRKKVALFAHRVAYELHRGAIPEGMNVLHKCDHPSCVNPQHLFLGSHTDNMRDMKSKGRLVNRRGSV